MKKTKDEIDEFLDVLFKSGFSIPDFSTLTVDGLLAAFKEDPQVISVEYKNGVFHIKTRVGPINFNFSGLQGKEDV